MDSLDRLVAHVEEAVRLSRDESDLASLRLGLMLFDAAAELLLHRSAEYLLAHDSLERQMLDRYIAEIAHLEKLIGQADDQDPRMLEALESAKTNAAEQEGRVLGAKRRTKIEQRFKDKANFVVQQTGALTPAALAVMGKLHRYRNDTYHQDKLRPATLAASTQIYGHIVLDLMTALEPTGGTLSGGIPPRLVKYFSEGTTPNQVVFKGQSVVADALRTEHATAVGRGISEALALHATDRLDDLDEILVWATNHLNVMPGRGESWTPEATLHYVQLDVPPFRSADDAVTQVVPVTARRLNQWRRRADRLAAESEPIKAFEKFSAIEDEMDEIETELHRVARLIDEYEDMEFERSRGN